MIYNVLTLHADIYPPMHHTGLIKYFLFFTFAIVKTVSVSRDAYDVINVKNGDSVSHEHAQFKNVSKELKGTEKVKL